MKEYPCGHSFAATENAIDTIARRMPGSPRQEVILTRLIAHVQTLLQSYNNETLSPQGINETTWMALMVLYSRPEQKMMPSELSESLAFSRTNATRIVDDLEQRGFIARHPCSIDRRRTYLALTEQGLAFIAEVMPEQRQRLRELWAAFNADERQMLETLLRKLLTNLDS